PGRAQARGFAATGTQRPGRASTPVRFSTIARECRRWHGNAALTRAREEQRALRPSPRSPQASEHPPLAQSEPALRAMAVAELARAASWARPPAATLRPAARAQPEPAPACLARLLKGDRE